MTANNPAPTQQGETLLLCPCCAAIPQTLCDSHCFERGTVAGWKIRCDNCGMQTCWWHSEVEAAQRWNARRAAVTGPRRDALLSDDDAALLTHAITIAREIQEFIWADCYPSLRPYDADGWRRLFQKRVDCIAEINLAKHGGLAALRKRLLQQAALSVKALALVNRWAKANPPQLSAGSDGTDLRDAATSSPTPAESDEANQTRN